jgi:hypothetical protein
MHPISLKGVAIGNITDIAATYVVVIPLIALILVFSGEPSAKIVVKQSTFFYVSYAILGGLCSVLGGLRFGTHRKARRTAERSALVDPLCRRRDVRRDQPAAWRTIY